MRLMTGWRKVSLRMIFVRVCVRSLRSGPPISAGRQSRSRIDRSEIEFHARVASLHALNIISSNSEPLCTVESNSLELSVLELAPENKSTATLVMHQGLKGQRS